MLIVLFSVLNAIAQDYFPKEEEFNGHYYSLKPIELRSGETPETVLCEVGEINSNNDLGMGILYAEGYMPAVYKFKPDLSKQIGKAFFFNDWGALIIEYDKESFIRVVRTVDKSVLDFFSKSKSKAATMTEEKALAYVKKYMEQFD